MAGWSLRQFRGIAPRVSPRLLADNQATEAVNCILWHGTLSPLTSNLTLGDVFSKTGTIQTIHRFGHDVDSDVNYWFHWAADVNVCRGQIFGDTEERTYYTDGVLPKSTNAAIALQGGTSYPMASYTLGVPRPSDVCLCSLEGEAAEDVLVEVRIYTYTYVTAWGEEGKPALPCSPVNFVPGQTVEVSNLGTSPPSGNYNITRKRLYRSVSSGTSSEYFFVAELAVSDDNFTDNLTSENLGEALTSTYYSMPPADLKGLVSMPNGMMAGFTGKDVYFCEAYKPYAWPISYTMATDYSIVALGVVDTTLVVLTKGFPYLMQGSSPDSMSMVKADVPQACVSKRSVAFLGGSVVYASPDGLFAIGNGSANLTEGLLTNVEWRARFNPSSIHGYTYDDKYIGFYDNGTVQGGFILDPKLGDLTTVSFYATAGYYDPQRDALFLVVGGNLVKFGAGEIGLTATWRSKIFYIPHPKNMGAIRVEAAAYPVTVEVFADGESKGVFSIVSARAQRLPSGFVANTWEFKVTSDVDVYSIGIAEAMEDLAHG